MCKNMFKGLSSLFTMFTIVRLTVLFVAVVSSLEFQTSCRGIVPDPNLLGRRFRSGYPD